MSDFEPAAMIDREGTLEITVWPDTLVGLHALISWLDGFEAAGKARVPGHFALVMHYRQLRQRLVAVKSAQLVKEAMSAPAVATPVDQPQSDPSREQEK